MEKLPASTDLVLVAFMPNPRDLEIARLLGWYRIPLATSPKVVGVDWLAFYQPATFGKGHKWRIEYIAPVRGHELATRIELFKEEPDHPRAYHEYYKIQLGPMLALPTPVSAEEWKRITFLYTTGERLLTAQTLPELTVKDEERKILWRALRERALADDLYQVDDLPEFPIPKEIVALFSFMS